MVFFLYLSGSIKNGTFSGKCCIVAVFFFPSRFDPTKFSIWVCCAAIVRCDTYNACITKLNRIYSRYQAAQKYFSTTNNGEKRCRKNRERLNGIRVFVLRKSDRRKEVWLGLVVLRSVENRQ